MIGGGRLTGLICNFINMYCDSWNVYGKIYDGVSHDLVLLSRARRHFTSQLHADIRTWKQCELVLIRSSNSSFLCVHQPPPWTRKGCIINDVADIIHSLMWMGRAALTSFYVYVCSCVGWGRYCWVNFVFDEQSRARCFHRRTMSMRHSDWRCALTIFLLFRIWTFSERS